jgi:putative heme iron utilization protein
LSTRQHAYTTSEPDPNSAPETSYAERSRTLLHVTKVGVLSTHSHRHEGFPFGSVMPYALDREGSPLFLVSSMAMHTQNLVRDSRASLLVTASEAARDPLGAERLTVIGNVTEVGKADLAAVRDVYLGCHENARYWVDFEDFAFYMMQVAELYFVGGFAVMGWVGVDDFREARPDPLAETAAEILRHMNDDHADALALIAKHVKDVEAKDAKMTAVDRLGFHVRLHTADRVRSVRIGFPSEVRSPDDCRAALVEMVKEARGTDRTSLGVRGTAPH